MRELTIIAGSTADVSIVPDVVEGLTNDAVTFEVNGASVELTDTGGVFSAILPKDTADPADGEQEWPGAFVITRTGPDGEQTSRVAVRVLVVLADMGLLVSLAQAKSYLRAEGDDMLIELLLNAAEASVRQRVGALEAAEVTEDVFVGRNSAVINLKNRPVASVSSVKSPGGSEWAIALANSDGGVSQFGFSERGAALTLNKSAGTLSSGFAYEERVLLTPGTWTITYTGGLSARSDYANVLPRIKLAVLYECEDAYDNRNARATAEHAGSQGVTLENSTALSPRAEAICSQILGSAVWA